MQPIVGYYSDRTWTRLGRRRPYFLVGAILASLALLLMPHSPTLWVAAGLLWILDASINISMEPFRAFVGDQLPTAQRADRLRDAELLHRRRRGGREHAAVAAGARGRQQSRATAGGVPDTVHYAFYLGAVVLFAAVGWTVLRTREYPPEALRSFAAAQPEADAPPLRSTPRRVGATAWCGLAVGIAAVVAIVASRGSIRSSTSSAACVLAWGVALLLRERRGRRRRFSRTIMRDLHAMPHTMRRLASVQFFSWFALFAMWIYTTAAVTQVHFGTHATPQSAAYNEGANWVGVLFGAYNGFAALAAVVIPFMVRALRAAHEPPDQSLARRHRR